VDETLRHWLLWSSHWFCLGLCFPAIKAFLVCLIERREWTERGFDIRNEPRILRVRYPLKQLSSSDLSSQSTLRLHRADIFRHWPLLHWNWLPGHFAFSATHTWINEQSKRFCFRIWCAIVQSIERSFCRERERGKFTDRVCCFVKCWTVWKSEC
jgi:hypothetical protein